MTKDGICEDAWQWDPNSGLGHPCPGVDWIDWGSAPLGWLYEYSAKGNEVVIKGFEIDLGYDFGNFELQYNLSYVHGDNKTLKMPLSYIHPMKEILEFNFNKKSMDYKLRFSKIHEQNRLGEFETYTPGVNLTDFIVSYSYMSHSITMQINNIFNEVYYNHLSRIKNITPELGTNIHFIYKVFI
jgi:iron complex outermembrane receptor protein